LGSSDYIWKGPFSTPIRRGAHQEAFVQKPNPDFLNELIDQIASLPTYLTIAPKCLRSKN
jgi:N-acetylglucosamine-6-phosphate deacetylase